MKCSVIVDDGTQDKLEDNICNYKLEQSGRTNLV